MSACCLKLGYPISMLASKCLGVSRGKAVFQDNMKSIGRLVPIDGTLSLGYIIAAALDEHRGTVSLGYIIAAVLDEHRGTVSLGYIIAAVLDEHRGTMSLGLYNSCSAG